MAGGKAEKFLTETAKETERKTTEYTENTEKVCTSSPTQGSSFPATLRGKIPLLGFLKVNVKLGI
jgi:hypothetical protein